MFITGDVQVCHAPLGHIIASLPHMMLHSLSASRMQPDVCTEMNKLIFRWVEPKVDLPHTKICLLPAGEERLQLTYKYPGVLITAYNIISSGCQLLPLLQTETRLSLNFFSLRARKERVVWHIKLKSERQAIRFPGKS